MTQRRSGPHLPTRSREDLRDDVTAELEFHLVMVAAELESEGWHPDDAVREARRRFGDLEYTRKYCSDQDMKHQQERSRMAFITELFQDIRFTLRSLRKSPGFSLVVLLTLALGIGATTAIFSVVRGVLIEPLPFRESDRLVRVWHENKANGIAKAKVSEPDFLDWKRESQLAESMGAFFYMDGSTSFDLTGEGRPVSVASALVAEGFFETLDTPPLLGRTITTEDQREGRNRVAVIGYSIWQNRFNGDPSVVGRNIVLNETSFEVVGVMPEHFGYPATGSLDVWIPLSFFGPDHIGRFRRAAFQGVVARLKPGVSQERLHDELNGIAARIAVEDPDNRGWESVTIAPLRESIVGDVTRPLGLLFGGVLLVLLITCANIASLLLARATSRQRELAVRAALGAGRGRITRQLLTESLVLALGGGGLGVLLAVVGVRAVAGGDLGIPRAELVSIDGTVLAFALGVSLLAGALFGILPALRATGASMGLALRAGTQGSMGAGGRLRRVLVVGQVGLAVMLVTVAALTTKSFARLQQVDLGFTPDNALFVDMSVPDQYMGRESAPAYYQSVLDAIEAIPGVVAAGAIRDLPTRGTGESVPVVTAGSSPDDATNPLAQFHQVSSGYFAAMEIPVRSGRVFDTRDRWDAPRVAIIDEELARRVFPGVDATTRTLSFGGTEVPIVGVVGSVRQSGAAEPLEPMIYFHNHQVFRSGMSIVVRTVGQPLDMANAVREAIWTINPTQTIKTVSSLEDVLGSAVSRPRLLASLFGLFGFLGFSLCTVGVYGLLAFSVTQRRQEIGVRIALGASARSVLQMVVRQGLELAFLGVGLGVIGSLAVAKSLQAVLFGIEAGDLMTFVQVAVAVLIAATVASLVPARRATAIDPAVALRQD